MIIKGCRQISKLITHLTEGNELLAEWVINWLAVYRQTGEVSHVALCLVTDKQNNGAYFMADHVAGRAFTVSHLFANQIRNNNRRWLSSCPDFYVLHDLEYIKRNPLLSRISELVECMLYRRMIECYISGRDLLTLGMSNRANIMIATTDFFCPVIKRFHDSCTVIMPRNDLRCVGTDFSIIGNENQVFQQYLLDYPIDLDKYNTAFHS